jgi:hypothetical protein
MAKDIKLLNFKYTKISVERNEDSDGELKITPNINIKNIEKYRLETSKQDALKVDFGFKIDYSSLGKVDLEGRYILLVDLKTFKEAIDGWKDKKIPDEVNMIFLNIIMQKASLKALELEEEMNFPPHIQLPRLQLGKKD